MKKLIPVFLTAMLLAAAAIPALAYDYDVVDATDVVGPHSWAVAEVEAADAAGLLTEHTSINMRANISRFQFAELIVNLTEKVTGEEISPAGADTFTDCSETAVLKAYAAGIVNGVGDNKFAPDSTTNREQIATMITRAIFYITSVTNKVYFHASPSIEKFSDKGDVSSWAVEGVGLLAANGIMNGTSETTCSPQAPCTIEQSILLVYRFFTQTL